eukprot:6198202-Pleurochrysis_carterae.AAC.2
MTDHSTKQKCAQQRPALAVLAIGNSVPHAPQLQRDDIRDASEAQAGKPRICKIDEIHRAPRQTGSGSNAESIVPVRIGLKELLPCKLAKEQR